MNPFLYQFFVIIYSLGIHIAALWNDKARHWVAGRKYFPSFSPAQKRIWVHCASLGEFEQGRPIIEALRLTYPHYEIVLSFFSPSGYEIRKNYAGVDRVIYLPSDTKKNANKLIKEMQPNLVVWVKYEYWYHYLTTLKEQQIPVLLVSANFRKSQPFFSGNSFWKKILHSFAHIFVQQANSSQLLANIGFDGNVTIAGDTRFDRVLTVAQGTEKISTIENFIQQKTTIVAGSTWKADEQLLAVYMQKHPQYQLIIAPHEIHSQHINDLLKLFPNAYLYSKMGDSTTAKTSNILIIDNIGMLSKLYRYGHLTYVGGGFNPSGIHNILEAAVFGKVVVFGPNYEKFAEAKALVEAGAAFSINDVLGFEKIATSLLANPQLLASKNTVAKKYIEENAGATKKIMDYIYAKRLLTN